jgi:hypothetical protein
LRARRKEAGGEDGYGVGRGARGEGVRAGPEDTKTKSRRSEESSGKKERKREGKKIRGKREREREARTNNT